MWKTHQFYGFDLGCAEKAITIITIARGRALTHSLQMLAVGGARKDAPLYFMTGPWRTAMTSKRTSFSHGYLLDLLLTELPGITEAKARLRAFAVPRISGFSVL